MTNGIHAITHIPILDFLSANILLNSFWGFWVHSENEISVIADNKWVHGKFFKPSETAWKTHLKNKSVLINKQANQIKATTKQVLSEGSSQNLEIKEIR